MNRATVALLAAFEAVITAAIGLGVALVPLTVVWAVQYHMSAPWTVFWQASADAWLVGSGADLSVRLDDLTAQGLGLGASVPPFTVTIAALGAAFFSFAMGARIGRRAAETPFPLTGLVSAVVAFGLVGGVVGCTAQSRFVAPSLWQSALMPALVLGLGALLGVAMQRAREGFAASERMPQPALAATAAALRGGIAAAVLVVAAASVVVAVLLYTHFGQVVSLYQALQTDYLGGVTLTLAQLAVLPNAVAWTAAWLVGPGFSLGAAGHVAPGGVHVGDLPGVPLLAIVPSEAPALAYAGVLVPVLAGVLAGALVRWRSRDLGPAAMAAAAGGSGVLAGALLGLLAWWSSGTLAPGALEDIGPNPLLVAGVAALEVSVGCALGLFAAALRSLLRPLRSPAHGTADAHDRISRTGATDAAPDAARDADATQPIEVPGR